MRCLWPKEAREVAKEVHSGECGSHSRKRRLHKKLLQLGYYWTTMEKNFDELVKACHVCQVLEDAIHTHPNTLQDMTTPWSFHTWGLDLIRPINPPFNSHIWILAAIEHFTKWVEAIPLKKATRAAVSNFIHEHIIMWFRIPRRLISDNGTLFVNKDVRSLVEVYHIKHRRSPYYL